jgi:hypothetical protein
MVSRDARVRVVDALVASALAPIVDLVAWPEGDASDPEQTEVVVAHADGRSRLTPDGSEVLHGRDPVANQDPRAFLPYDGEVADPSPPNARNAYPLARERLARVFAHPSRSPDLVVVHAPRHYFPETGGHVGEHGSLDVIQSRAPLLVAAPGVPARGVVEGWARVVDVAPTLAALAGVPTQQHHDRAGRPLDGQVVEALVPPDAPRPRWVIGTLRDGAHCGELLAMAAAGELPGVARLLERGTALDGGALAEFPSVTLANHTSLLTGVGVHRHGILGNLYRDRTEGRTVNTNTGSAWHLADSWTSPEVASVFDLVAAARPGASTVSINEPTDRGASASTMQVIRAAGSARGADDLGHLLPDPSASPFVESVTTLDDPYYAFCTQVDDAGLQQVLQAWETAAVAPALTWWSATVTDAGHHAGGPRSAPARQSLREADRRLQALLEHLDRLGVADEVAVLLTADHGFEGSDPECRGGWSDALASTGVSLHDVGSGFIYLDG